MPRDYDAFFGAGFNVQRKADKGFHRGEYCGIARRPKQAACSACACRALQQTSAAGASGAMIGGGLRWNDAGSQRTERVHRCLGGRSAEGRAACQPARGVTAAGHQLSGGACWAGAARESGRREMQAPKVGYGLVATRAHAPSDWVGRQANTAGGCVRNEDGAHGQIAARTSADEPGWLRQAGLEIGLGLDYACDDSWTGTRELGGRRRDLEGIVAYLGRQRKQVSDKGGGARGTGGRQRAWSGRSRGAGGKGGKRLVGGISPRWLIAVLCGCG